MKRVQFIFGLILVVLVVSPSNVLAQEVDTLEVVLPEVEVQGLRYTSVGAGVPFSISVLARSPEDLAFEPGLSLQSTLRGLPGLWVADRGHFALGERVLIRGMGWRSAFGVRGIQVVLDGIPLTLADGQSSLDIADPAYIRRAELVRGPASTFWGNGSGGVLVLSTAAFSDSRQTNVRLMGGSNGTQQILGDISLPVGRHRLQGLVSYTDTGGYREYAKGSFIRSSLHGSFDFGPRTRLSTVAALAIQETESPGALTQQQLAEDRRQADVRNVSARAGKESTQAQMGATLRRQSGVGLVTATAYGLFRRLDNPLSFTYIDLDRLAGGVRLQLENDKGTVGWGTALDLGWQSDDRININNDAGKPGTTLELDQEEFVRAFAPSGYVKVDMTSRLTSTVGLRIDFVTFTLDNRLPQGADQSGIRSFSAISPSLGLAYRLDSGLLFANLSSGFETPTTTELVNQPGGGAGLNDTVVEQITRGFELGFRGRIGQGSLDIALFTMRVTDLLQPYQDNTGRTFFENAGENVHRGVEVSLSQPLWGRSSMQITYTGSQFLFKDEVLDGKKLPGIPDHHLFVNVTAESFGLRGSVSANVVSEMFADDANETSNSGYVVFDVEVGLASWMYGQKLIQPFFRVGNVLDKEYVGSLVVNAFGGRYFEPSAGRTVQFGVGLSL